MRLTTFVVASLLVGSVPATSIAGPKSRQIRFAGIHPIPKSEGGGICYIEGPHVHIFGADKLQYRVHHDHDHDADVNVFVGDPVAFGWDGPKVAYKGHHPIVVAEGDVEYCYLDGPHFHVTAPPPGPEFEVRGDAYFFVGEPAPIYVEQRPAMIKINAVYTPIVYARPAITVEAPAAWINVRYPVVVVAPPAPRVDVVVPHVDVVVPNISIGIGVGVGFGVGGGGHVHHDNGRHRGHRK